MHQLSQKAIPNRVKKKICQGISFEKLFQINAALTRANHGK